MYSKGRRVGGHGEELKALVLGACAEPGASVAAVARAHRLNANLVHKWRRGPARVPQQSMTTDGATCSADKLVDSFVPLQLPAQPSMATPPDIRIELRRGTTSIAVTWPAAAASEFAA